MTRCLISRMLAIGCAVTGCDATNWTGPQPEILQVVMVEVERPDIFARTATARRAQADTPGMWASVPGLPQPERSRVRNLETGLETVVALYVTGTATGGDAVQLSSEAAEAIGLAEGQTARVSLVALRVEPNVQIDGERF